MMNEIDFSGLTVYKKHCTLYMDRYVFKRLFYLQKSSLLPVRISKYMLIYDLPHELHNS